MEDEDNNEMEKAIRPPLLPLALVIAMVNRFRSGSVAAVPIDWPETRAEVAARFFVGLMAGGGLCVALFPVLFWPDKRGRISIHEFLGQPTGIGWMFLAVFLGAGLLAAVTTRVALQNRSSLESAVARLSGSDVDDRVKTGCAGLLLPLVIAAFGYYRITHPRRLNRFTGTPNDPQDVVALGIVALGIAVVVHAFGFVPYHRIPVLKYLLAAAGVVLFVYGLKWPFSGS